MQLVPKGAWYPETVLTFSQAIILFLVVATLTADAAAILFVLGLFTLWESAVTLVTVMALAAGMIWTVMWLCQKKFS